MHKLVDDEDEPGQRKGKGGKWEGRCVEERKAQVEGKKRSGLAGGLTFGVEVWGALRQESETRRSFVVSVVGS